MEREEPNTGMTPEEYGALHKAAFRTAFDFLKAHFPPGTDAAWWEQAAKDVSEASAAAGENRLALELLSGVYDYLDDERRKRE